VSPPPSGIYQLRVLHANEDIAHEPDLDGLIVWQSDPVKVRVVNRLPPDGRNFASTPVLVLLTITATCLGIAALWQRWRTNRDQAASVRWSIGWRDGLALALLLLLASGWQFDSQRMSQKYVGVRQDEFAPWSLEVVK